MKKAILLLVVMMVALRGSAQISGETPDGIIDNFFKVYAREGVKAAVANIYTYGDSSMQSSLKYVQDTLAHTSNNIGGKYLGSEQIIKKNVTESLCLYTYLVKYRLAPLRFTFIFYKPQDKWEVMSFLFDSNVVNDLGKTARELKN